MQTSCVWPLLSQFLFERIAMLLHAMSSFTKADRGCRGKALSLGSGEVMWRAHKNLIEKGCCLWTMQMHSYCNWHTHTHTHDTGAKHFFVQKCIYLIQITDCLLVSHCGNASTTAPLCGLCHIKSTFSLKVSRNELLIAGSMNTTGDVGLSHVMGCCANLQTLLNHLSCSSILQTDRHAHLMSKQHWYS